MAYDEERAGLGPVTTGYAIDPNSDTWRAVRAHIKQRKKLRRDNLEAPGLDVEETEQQRGAIQELNELISLVNSPVVRIIGADDVVESIGGETI